MCIFLLRFSRDLLSTYSTVDTSDTTIEITGQRVRVSQEHTPLLYVCQSYLSYSKEYQIKGSPNTGA